MASRAEGFGWLAVVLAVLVWVLCAVPIAAQYREGSGVEAGDKRQSSTKAISTGVIWFGTAATADAVIEEMAQQAGVIFAGQVVAVRRPVGWASSGGDGAEGVVEVDFRVDQAVRGVAAASVYTLGEWSGLWSASGGIERYRVGQRLLVFLYAQDEQGLSSPVRGMDGAIPLRGGGTAPGPDETSAAAAEWMVDLRWIQAQALRREALLAMPIRGPVRWRPIGRGPIQSYAAGGGPDRSTAELESPLARRVPDPPPQAAQPVETEPLAQVIALCKQAMESAHALR